MRKDIKTKKNLIVALRPYVTGELIVAQTETPHKSIPEHKKYQKCQKPNEEEDEIIEFVEEEEEEQQIEVVAPRGHLSSGVQLFHLLIYSIHRPPVHPESGRRPLEIREPHAVHVQNLKRKMKINPHATVVPFLVIVDHDQCPIVADFKYKSAYDYTYYIIG